ncbi:uncharacterized protein TM35_000381220 [Trypanosoma theileri]|uniref:SURP motif domain-containing protein n=1 Tax=Trypanosoma theileri TaxID=67003 RepID=A0A1X0NK63_9TRYP|nr:uncharacterized protein TM35_000381220 [Trypanosoma theileri]ORC85047.1 hypothetical protein TM35_000381220 [Trypanosoma theileri]
MSFSSGNSRGGSNTGGGHNNNNNNNNDNNNSINYYYSHHSRGSMNSGSGARGRRPRSPSPPDRHASPQEYHHNQHHYYNQHSQQQQQQQYMQRGGGRHSPPRRPPYRRRRDEMPYTIPNIAPRLQVPHDLPVDVTAFLDLVAFYVVQGGPTAEEEIMKREENNPHFAFLHNPWNHPMQIYYRWRLYSLLQGDTMLKWRTEPFQMERGNDAYVWVPPPAISSGPESLLNVFTQEVPNNKNNTNNTNNSSTITSSNNSTMDMNRDARTTNTNTNSTTTTHPVPSASWLSRMCVSEGAFFVTLGKSAVVEWQQLLHMEHHVTEATRSGQTLEERLTALTAVLLDRGLIAQRMVFAVEHQHAALHLMSLALDEVLRLAYEAARSLRDIGVGSNNSEANTNNTKQSSNTNSGSAHHMNNTGNIPNDNNNSSNNSNNVGDCALRAAARCCMCLSYLFTLNDIGKNGNTAPLTDEEVAHLAPLWEGPSGVSNSNSTNTNTNTNSNSSNTNINTSGNHSNPMMSTTKGTTTTSHTDDYTSSLSSGLLPLPSPLNPAASSSSLSSSTTILTTTTATATTAGGGGGGASLRLLNRALEKIIPTLIEATLIVALCTVQQYGALTVDNAQETSRSSAKPPGAEEMEGILPLDIDQAAYVHVQAKLAAARAAVTTTGTTTTTGINTNISAAVMTVRKEDRDAVCMIALLLISWLKQLCASWAESDVIGSRCWSTLLTKYVCLLSQPIETT